MNDVILNGDSKRRRLRRLLENLAWSAANQLAMGGLCAWRLEEPNLMIARHSMALEGLHEDWHGAKIAHVADLHLGPLTTESYLGEFIERINEFEPDFVTVAGDIITGPRTYARAAGRLLRRLRPRVASLAIMGNHDYGLFHPTGWGRTRGLAEYLAGQLADAGLHVLLNTSQTYSRGRGLLQFVGLEDLWSQRMDARAAFARVRTDVPAIALCHNPDAAPELAQRGAQWVLAGHTHGKSSPTGGIHDRLLPVMYRQFVAGYYALDEGRHLYVNRGLGHSRRTDANSRPEITIFTLCGGQPRPA